MYGSPVREVPEVSHPVTGEAPVTPSLEYEDFRLGIAGAEGEYRATVLQSPAGESNPDERVAWASVTDTPRKDGEIRARGTALFDAFFVGQIRELYRESVAIARERGKGLRIKLMIDNAGLSAEPWELLCDPRGKRYVALSTRTPVVRHRRMPEAIEPLDVAPPIRILGMIANPLDPGFPNLNVENERKVIDTALADLTKSGLVKLEWLEGGTGEALQRAVSRGWHVFHFIGHGDYDLAAAEGRLVLEKPDGGARPIGARDLGLLLREQGGVRLAILNSCKGAVGDTAASFTSTADVLVQGGMGGVVGMQNPISDQAAITFSRILYLALADGLPLDAAVASARVAMKIARETPIEWWTPVLHMRVDDGVLFRLPARSASSRHVPGAESLGAALDVRLEKVTRFRRWHSRAVMGWALMSLPLLAFLVRPVPSASIAAEIEASGASIVTASARDLFADGARLGSFGVQGFDRVTPPDWPVPTRPGSGEPAQVVAEGKGPAGGVFLHAWAVPSGSRVSLDRPSNAPPGEYLLALGTGAGKAFNATLAGPVELSIFERAPSTRDFGPGAPLTFVTSDRALKTDLRFVDPGAVKLPDFVVSDLQLTRAKVGPAGLTERSTVVGARLRFDEVDRVAATVGEGKHLRFRGVRDGSVERLRLTEPGLALGFHARVTGVTVGADAIRLPSRFDWLLYNRRQQLSLLAFAYALILALGILSRRVSHGPASAK